MQWHWTAKEPAAIIRASGIQRPTPWIEEKHTSAVVIRTKGMYLGTLATAADAEAVGVMLAWERCDRVALDS